MNMQAVMAQAKKMQKNLEKISQEIDEKEFSTDDENINIIITGNYNIKKFEIKNNDLLLDKEMLEDIINVSFKKVLEQIQKEKDNKLGKYTNGLGGLF